MNDSEQWGREEYGRVHSNLQGIESGVQLLSLNKGINITNYTQGDNVLAYVARLKSNQ